MNKLQLLATALTIIMMLLSGCARNHITVSPTVPIAVTEAVASIDVTGTWKLDGPKTEANLQNYDSLPALYGTGLQNGAELVLDENGSMHYFIGINNGGEGTYALDGSAILADVNPYVVDSLSTVPLTIQVLEENGTTYLVMEDLGESIYWTR